MKRLNLLVEWGLIYVLLYFFGGRMKIFVGYVEFNYFNCSVGLTWPCHKFVIHLQTPKLTTHGQSREKKKHESRFFELRGWLNKVLWLCLSFWVNVLLGRVHNVHKDPWGSKTKATSKSSDDWSNWPRAKLWTQGVWTRVWVHKYVKWCSAKDLGCTTKLQFPLIKSVRKE